MGLLYLWVTTSHSIFIFAWLTSEACCVWGWHTRDKPLCFGCHLSNVTLKREGSRFFLNLSLLSELWGVMCLGHTRDNFCALDVIFQCHPQTGGTAFHFFPSHLKKNNKTGHVGLKTLAHVMLSPPHTCPTSLFNAAIAGHKPGLKNAEWKAYFIYILEGRRR
jgi:hypothetical protein